LNVTWSVYTGANRCSPSWAFCNWVPQYWSCIEM
jgi:hypothetical protein